MIIRIGTIDGTVHTSMHWPDEKVEDELRDNDGKLGFGAFADIETDTIEEFAEVFCEMLVGDSPVKDYNLKSFRLLLPGGINRYLRPDHIVWAEVEFDE